MKLLNILGVAAAVALMPGLLAAQSDYTATERGLNYTVYQKTNVVGGTNLVQHYTELANGLNYTNSFGQLVPSMAIITPLPGGGAQAIQGQHQVTFPGDIGSGV